MSRIFITETVRPAERVILDLIGEEYKHSMWHQGRDIVVEVHDPSKLEGVVKTLARCPGLRVSVEEGDKNGY